MQRKLQQRTNDLELAQQPQQHSSLRTMCQWAQHACRPSVTRPAPSASHGRRQLQLPFSHASRAQRIPRQAAAANSAGDRGKVAVARFTAREAVVRRMRGGERVIAARRYCADMQQRRLGSWRRRVGVQFGHVCNACG
jgi:hypothetical protein